MPAKEETLPLEHASEIAIHRNLSFSRYFSGYSRETDGTVRIATYSFDMSAIVAIHRLMPFSTFYLAPKYEAAAEAFLRKFPLYVVYIVEGLHTKCIYYQKSRRALIGSQNLFSSASGFEELNVELTLSDAESDRFEELAFTFSNAKYLRVIYGKADITRYQGIGNGVEGYPHLPCHREFLYWQSLSQSDTTQAFPTYHYLYLVLEYEVDGMTAYLAFDRHYRYCGELDEEAFQYLCASFSRRTQQYAFLERGSALPATAPFKDQFAKYHPVARDSKAKCAHYFNEQ